MSPYTCKSAFSILETTYGGNLTVAEMAFIENLLYKKKDNSETAENFIENWIQLSLQAGITRSVQNDTRQQAKLIKLFEKGKLYTNAIQMSYMTDKIFDEMITLIIKEDENLRSKDQEVIKVNFENKSPSTILKITENKYRSDSREKNPYRNNTDTYSNQYDPERSPYRGNRERSPYRGNRDRNDFRTNYQQNSYNRNYQQNNRYLDNNNNKQYRDNREKRSRERSSDRYRSKSNERQKSTHTNTEANKRQRKEDGKCWNFAETGTCRFGENCRFSHSK